MKKLNVFVAIISLSLSVISIILCKSIFKYRSTTNQQEDLKIPIDVVYTWVNGSDPEFIRNISQYLPLGKYGDNFRDQNQAHKIPYRYYEYDGMKYSLRSVEKYAPWVRNIYIVTNGQIPNWLNLSNSRVHLITHEDIFPNKSHLPTFSSPAIESHLFRISNLSKLFLYINDDILLTAPISLQDFITDKNEYKIRLDWGIWRIKMDAEISEYDASLLFINRLYDKTYRNNLLRNAPPHIPFLINRDIMRSLVSKFPREFQQTSSNRFRSSSDMQFACSYYYFIIEERKWPYVLDMTDETWGYVEVDYRLNSQQQRRKLKRRSKKFLCLNGHIDNFNKTKERLFKRSLKKLYEELFPYKSQFEI